jgi:hypothetical protein
VTSGTGSSGSTLVVSCPTQTNRSRSTSTPAPGLLHQHEIELARVEAPGERPALPHGELEGDLRVLLPEVAQDARQLRDREVVGGAEPDAAARGLRGEVALGGGVRGEDGAGEPGEGLARVGEPHLTGVPQHEGASYHGLEAPDVLADGRLAEPQPVAGPGEALGVGHTEEGPQQHRVVHDRPLSFEIRIRLIRPILSCNDWNAPSVV